MKYFDNVVDNDVDNDEGRLSFEDIIASGSLPPGFPMTKVNGDYYWDGGLLSNTPLSPALNRLEEIETDKRELVVIELFPREIPIPDNLPDVMNRMVQLQFTNRLKLDEKLFETVNDFVELVERIDKSVDPNDPIRQEEGYKKTSQAQEDRCGFDYPRQLTSRTDERRRFLQSFDRGKDRSRVSGRCGAENRGVYAYQEGTSKSKSHVV